VGDVSVSVNVEVVGDKNLQEKFALVTGPDSRQKLNQSMGSAVREKIADHLAKVASEKHTTAQRLGATPSGHLEQAARAVEKTPVESDSLAAYVTLNHPGLGRAFHDVTIVPHGDYPLTIPINAIAYNRRVGQLRMEGHDIFRPLKKGAKAIGHKIGDRKTAIFSESDRMNVYVEKQGQSLVALYALTRSVTQMQDSTLMPTAQELTTAAIAGAISFFDEDIKKFE
jgi:hypothetical protein